MCVAACATVSQPLRATEEAAEELVAEVDVSKMHFGLVELEF